MENIRNNLIQGGNLPSIFLVINQLKQRLIRLEEEQAEYSEIDMDILFLTEIKKTKDLLRNIEENQLQQSSDNDIIIENTHASLEIEYLKAKRIIEEKMIHHQILGEIEVSTFNSSLHSYNLFNSIIESIFSI